MTFSYTITVGSPRAYVAALLATSFAATEPGERDDVAALNKTAQATADRAAESMDALTLEHCLTITRHLRAKLANVRGVDRVAIMAAVIREMLVDAPETFCALDKRVRDVCERRFPATPDQQRLAGDAAREAVAQLSTVRRRPA